MDGEKRSASRSYPKFVHVVWQGWEPGDCCGWDILHPVEPGMTVLEFVQDIVDLFSDFDWNYILCRQHPTFPRPGGSILRHSQNLYDMLSTVERLYLVHVGTFLDPNQSASDWLKRITVGIDQDHGPWFPTERYDVKLVPYTTVREVLEYVDVNPAVCALYTDDGGERYDPHEDLYAVATEGQHFWARAAGRRVTVRYEGIQAPPRAPHAIEIHSATSARAVLKNLGLCPNAHELYRGGDRLPSAPEPNYDIHLFLSDGDTIVARPKELTKEFS